MFSIAQLIRELPDGYAEACFKEKAIQRKREISTPDDLMMLSLFHLINGCSLVEISTIAELAKIGNISDVAFMKRFEHCEDWFKWIISQLVSEGLISYQKPKSLEKYNIIGVDATTVSEKGRSRRLFRLHLAVDIFKMETLQHLISARDVGETLTNFTIHQDDLVIADRAYCSKIGIKHCLSGGGNFILRYRRRSFNLYNSKGDKVELLEHLQSLKNTDVLELRLFMRNSDGTTNPVRICGIRKSLDAITKSRKRLQRQESREGIKFTEQTKDFNDYIVLISNLRGEVSATDILDIYRFRWQVEIYFKRLKSIMDFGELPKRRDGSIMSWLHGKLMVALLIEKMIGKVDFSPCGD